MGDPAYCFGGKNANLSFKSRQNPIHHHEISNRCLGPTPIKIGALHVKLLN